MLIFGFGAGAPKDHGPAVPVRCPNCHNEVEYRYAVSRSWFRLFFVPIIPYKTRHLLLCPICSRGVSLTGEQGAVARGLVEATADRHAGRLDADAYRAKVDAFLGALTGGTGGDRPSAAAATPVPRGPGAPPAPAIPAGWYPDPHGAAEQRYWDGSRWTNGTIPPT